MDALSFLTDVEMKKDPEDPREVELIFVSVSAKLLVLLSKLEAASLSSAVFRPVGTRLSCAPLT